MTLRSFSRCQGWYRPMLYRLGEAAAAKDFGLPGYREPRPRVPWDPRAVSDPRLIHPEFPEFVRLRGGVPVPPRSRIVAGFPRHNATIKASKETPREFPRVLDNLLQAEDLESGLQRLLDVFTEFK